MEQLLQHTGRVASVEEWEDFSAVALTALAGVGFGSSGEDGLVGRGSESEAGLVAGVHPHAGLATDVCARVTSSRLVLRTMPI